MNIEKFINENILNISNVLFDDNGNVKEIVFRDNTLQTTDEVPWNPYTIYGDDGYLVDGEWVPSPGGYTYKDN